MRTPIDPATIGRLVSVTVAALEARYPAARLLPSEQVRRATAEQTLETLRRLAWAGR